jgi:hypothetical protein
VHDDDLAVAREIDVQLNVATAHLQRQIEGRQRILQGIR